MGYFRAYPITSIAFVYFFFSHLDVKATETSAKPMYQTVNGTYVLF